MTDLRASFLTRLRHPAVAPFVEKALSIAPGPFPYHDYFAFNYDRDGIISLKIYFCFYRPLERLEVLKLLPDEQKFFERYPLWQPSKTRSINHSGCSFAIKIKDSGDPTFQFHYRVPYGDHIVPPRLFPMAERDREFWPGFSSEYTGNEVLDKRYYYLQHSPGIREWLRKRGERDCGQFIEYTETDTWSKVISWHLNYPAHQEHVAGVLSTPMKSFFAQLSEELGVTPVYPGLYEDGSRRSIYLFKLKYGGLDPFPFSLDGHDRAINPTFTALL